MFNRIIIFSGTTEGRELSKHLADAGIFHYVSVASDYGQNMMEESEYVSIHVGKMEADEMVSYMTANGFNSESIIVDASHPYAQIVSENIVKAAKKIGAKVIRVYRDSTCVSAGLLHYKNIHECAEALNKTEGNILLTTGSKELSKFCENVSDELINRLYVRVLPAVESIELCKRAGIADKNIIAMHGPFSVDMNMALIKQYNIKHLVTKDSGANGGVYEKVEAALASNCKCYVIDRPTVEEGITVAEAYKLLVDSDVERENTDELDSRVIKYDHIDELDGRVIKREHTATWGGGNLKRKIKITLAGAGMGNISNLTNKVKYCIDSSDVIFGARRLVSDIKDKDVYEMYLAKDIIPVIEANDSYNNILILFSGDTGFYSGTKKMQAELVNWSREKGTNLEINIYPGISSISYLAAKLGESYDDAFIYSLHGRGNVQELVNNVRYSSKCFSLLSDGNDIKRICSQIFSLGINAEVYVGSNLSCASDKMDSKSYLSCDSDKMDTKSNLACDSEDVHSERKSSKLIEKIIKIDSSNWESVDYSDFCLATVLIKNLSPERRPIINIKSDDEFIRAKVPMTKESIRHESIIKLGLRENDVVYDVGAGTGSVAIEIAGLSDTLKVYAIEKKPEAIELLKENIGKHNAYNVELVQGDALDVIKRLEKPDAVFIGGSSGELKEIIEHLASFKSNIRIVINAVSLETISEINSIVTERNIKDISIMQLSVANVNGIGNYHLLQAQNPVMIFSFTV